MVRYKIIFQGCVQGVGFRMFVSQIANKHSITGYAKNLYTGDVEVCAQGEESDVDVFLGEVLKLKRGLLRIDDYHLKKIPLVLEESKFKTVY